MQKKRIVLGLPKSFNMFEAIKKNMEHYGYEVISICFEDHTFKYKNFGQKAYNFIRKTFLNDKHYKGKLKFAFFSEEINKILDAVEGEIDYTLLIRADIYPKEIISRLKKTSKKLIAYQWDGLHRFPAIYNYIPYFDRFFVFDKNDLSYSKHKLLPLSNFYFDFDRDFIKNKDAKNDIFFVGSYIRKRMPQIEAFIKKSRELNLKLDFHIFFTSIKDSKLIKSEEINHIFEHMPYEENIARLKNSKIVIDFLNETHTGLSFRTFEALYYNKKLITNNTEVKKYDFYNPNNIFVWDGLNLEGVEEFINTPYQEVNEEIKLKYGFKNWLNYVLDEGEYTPINLPK
ncbi:conserved hypothetical protein [Tenacibaculum sp. 190524A02b]|uniref:Uncharacterized protein n=1 Tax=Tenacibaculum vairaonense TaxID=3137860 RepID=A0ABM9PIJ4_9FLAO